MSSEALTSSELSLTQEEVKLLAIGLMEWSGPGRPTNDFAVAMGFADARSLPDACARIRSAILKEAPMAPSDWARALIATELAFVSVAIGSGVHWSTTTGWKDDETVRTLRGLQRKLAKTVIPVVRSGDLGRRNPH